MTHQFRWSEEQTTQLIEMHKAGLSREEMSRALDIEPSRIRGRLGYLGLAATRGPRKDNDIDLGSKMHELARLRFSIDECAFVLGVDLPKAFELAEWYCVTFDEVPVDITTVKMMMRRSVRHSAIAKQFGCSTQKITAIANAIKNQRRKA